MSALSSPAMKSWQGAFDAQSGISASQRQAYEAFVAQGLPTSKNDAWKYTDLRRFAMRQFRLPAVKCESTAVELLLPLKDSYRLVFVDGVLLPSLPSWERAGERGLSFSTHRNRSPSPQPSPTTGEGVRSRVDAFELLNAAFATDVQIAIADDKIVDQPLYLAFVWTQATGAVMVHPRITVTIGRHSKATLIEHHIGVNAEANFINTVFDVTVGDHATLEHVRVQDDAETNFNIDSVHATVAQGASYLNYQYVLGGGLARTDIHIKLAGAEAHAELHGLVFAHQTQHLDVRTVIDHQVPNTRSIEDYRGIANHRGRVVFNGKVIVSKDAQKTDAKQSSRNLLLSPHAEIDTRPELEIYANDVKCAHGATVGQLDAAALFYLQSRGIARAEARALLTHAFAAEVIERIPVPAVREHVLTQLTRRMRAEGATP